ncbi:hypothetical protein TWF718_001089 [Orbilia javanica]|uniref:Uncharacterized protein n=1 Tax=Orbilia javanica TaxID=47235 RepID=A0AAN8N8B6_9PEZI
MLMLKIPLKLVFGLVLSVEIIYTGAIPVDLGANLDVEVSKKETQLQGTAFGNTSGTKNIQSLDIDKKELKRAPPPGGYYQYSKTVQCATPDRVRELWDAMAHSPVRGARNWRDLDNQMGREAVNSLIANVQRGAYQCICSHHPLIGGADQGSKLRAVSTSQTCQTESVARMYEKVYGCGCYALYTQQGAERDGIPAGSGGGIEGSLLLDGMPEGIHDRMRDTPLEGSSDRFTGSYTGYSNFHLGDYTTDKQLVPGTKEPYWLEGPGQPPRDSAWGWGWIKDQIRDSPVSSY